MIGIKTLKSATELNTARRIVKYVLIYCHSGKLTISVDGTDFNLSDGEVITITSGQIHCIKKTVKAEGYVIEFTLDFFCKDDKDIELIFHNGLFCHFALNEVITVNKAVIENYMEIIEKELLTKPYQYLISVHSQLELILVAINRSKIERGDDLWKPDALFLLFLEAVRNNFEYNYPLSHYAQMLDTTVSKLNELAKIHTGKTAQNVIYGLIFSEAKRLLMYEGLLVKEVAYKLGFKDPFYFSIFFKKHANISPKSYQSNYSL